MNRLPLVQFALTSFLALSCSNQDFTGQSANAVAKQPPPPPKTPETTSTLNPPSPSGQVTVNDGNTIACVRGSSPVRYSLSVSSHRDSARMNSTNLPQADILESQVIRFDSNAVVGNLLPVTSFGLDDVAFIVKETDQFTKNGRNINIPKHALLIKDGNNVNGAVGYIDSSVNTTYNFDGKSRTIGTAKQVLATALNTIAGMGITPLAHNQIKIADMRERGFIDAQGQVAFKLIHIAHGIGYINLELVVQPCK